jgi:hypothetical protein
MSIHRLENQLDQVLRRLRRLHCGLAVHAHDELWVVDEASGQRIENLVRVGKPALDSY